MWLVCWLEWQTEQWWCRFVDSPPTLVCVFPAWFFMLVLVSYICTSSCWRTERSVAYCALQCTLELLLLLHPTLTTVLWPLYTTTSMLSVLWHCWLGVRKSIRSVKIEWWCVSVVICLVWGVYCLWSSWCHCIPVPHHLLPHLNPELIWKMYWFWIGFTFLVPAYPGCPGKEATKQVY